MKNQQLRGEMVSHMMEHYISAGFITEKDIISGLKNEGNERYKKLLERIQSVINSNSTTRSSMENKVCNADILAVLQGTYLETRRTFEGDDKKVFNYMYGSSIKDIQTKMYLGLDYSSYEESLNTNNFPTVDKATLGNDSILEMLTEVTFFAIKRGADLTSLDKSESNVVENVAVMKKVNK